MKYMYPNKIMRWSSLQTDKGDPIKADENMKAFGFVPVYESLQDLIDDHGNHVSVGYFMPLDTDETKAS